MAHASQTLLNSMGLIQTKITKNQEGINKGHWIKWHFLKCALTLQKGWMVCSLLSMLPHIFSLPHFRWVYAVCTDLLRLTYTHRSTMPWRDRDGPEMTLKGLSLVTCMCVAWLRPNALAGPQDILSFIHICNQKVYYCHIVR